MLGADPDPGLPLRLSICLKELLAELSKGCSAGAILEKSEKEFEMVFGDAVRISGGGGGMMGRKESVRDDLEFMLRCFRRWRTNITSPTMTKATTTRAMTVIPMAKLFLEGALLPVPAAAASEVDGAAVASEDDGAAAPAVEDSAKGSTSLVAPVLAALLEVTVRGTSTDACDSVNEVAILLVVVVDESGIDAGIADVVGLAAELEVAVGIVVIDELMTVDTVVLAIIAGAWFCTKTERWSKVIALAPLEASLGMLYTLSVC